MNAKKASCPAPHSPLHTPYPTVCLPRSAIVLVLARGDGNVKTHKYVKSQTRSQSQKCCDSAWHQLTHTHAHTQTTFSLRGRVQDGDRKVKDATRNQSSSRPKRKRRRVGRTQIELYSASNKVTGESTGNQAQREGGGEL